jgi:phosphorylase kinase alpha/beta subunit
LMQRSPHEIQMRLRQLLLGYEGFNQALFKQESLRIPKALAIDWVVLPEKPEEEEDWLQKRRTDGSTNRVPKDFYPSVWSVLEHCRGLVIGDKLERRNRLDSNLVLEMTSGEKNFALQVEHLLNKIEAPEYRQANVEALMELAAIADRNPDLRIAEYIVLDVLVGHAVRLSWLEQHPQDSDRYPEVKATAWRSFYRSSPYAVASAVAKALQFLSELGQTEEDVDVDLDVDLDVEIDFVESDLETLSRESPAKGRRPKS